MPTSDKYADATIEGRAVVSLESGSVNLEEHHAVRIVTPRAFLGLLRARHGRTVRLGSREQSVNNRLPNTG